MRERERERERERVCERERKREKERESQRDRGKSKDVTGSSKNILLGDREYTVPLRMHHMQQDKMMKSNQRNVSHLVMSSYLVYSTPQLQTPHHPN